MNYICTHTDFILPDFVDNSNYTIITDGTELQSQYTTPIMVADNELAPMKHCYSEGFQIYDIYKRQPDYEWVGIQHYRRYFKPDGDFNKTNIIPRPFLFNVRQQYARCHNIEDYDEMISIVNKLYPEKETDLPNMLFPCNCCILKHEIFNEWCDFIFNCTFEFNDRHNLHTDEDVKRFIDTKQKNGDYQNRLCGFLLERLSTIFFLNYFKDKPTEVQMKDLHLLS